MNTRRWNLQSLRAYIESYSEGCYKSIVRHLFLQGWPENNVRALRNTINANTAFVLLLCFILRILKSRSYCSIYHTNVCSHVRSVQTGEANMRNSKTKSGRKSALGLPLLVHSLHHKNYFKHLLKGFLLKNPIRGPFKLLFFFHSK